MNSFEPSASHLEDVWQLMASHQYKAAEQAINELLDDGYADHATIHELARCQLALENHDEALNNYTHLLHHAEDADFKSTAEAALVLDKTKNALPLFETALQQDQRNPEIYFLLAVTEYKLGFIQQCRAHIQNALLLGFEWDDDDPIDYVIQQALPIREFHDFEQLYLDASEILKKIENPQNRWFSLNMPVHDIFSADKAERQKQRAVDLVRLLSPHFDDFYLSNGRHELWRILDDLSNSDKNAEFGQQARQALKQDDFKKIAQLILALELEHLKQFASSFGLSHDQIDGNLQQLLPLLPLPLAVAIMFLYTASHPEDKLPHYNHKIDNDIMAGVLAACFVSYYQQVEKYRSTTKEPDQK